MNSEAPFKLGKARIPAPTATTMYVCIASYATDGGVHKAGEHLLGSALDVIANPRSWAPANLDDAQLQDVIRERFGDYAQFPGFLGRI